ncbi:MAG: glycosyltransferase family 4 protein [Hyphomicrobiales bacterium]|nr:glycosyltransferase family 4 protein [Hyphomicrobiales bacterium]
MAFYAPMKPPDHPVPSGDRTMARALMAALNGAVPGDIAVVSRLRSRDGAADATAQDQIFAAAEREFERLSATTPPDAWLTYHSYYKAPDLLGPRLSRHWRIPYAIVEGTRAASRLTGPYARFAKAAEIACDAADVIFYLTEYDRQALERDRPADQKIVRLRPFLAEESLQPVMEREQTTDTVALIACGMFRPGDKLASYAALARSLALVQSDGWQLRIIGDGPVRSEVEALFLPFGNRIAFVGALDAGGVAREFQASDLLVWPGVGEAFGMVYLEAQAQACPVLAEDREGVRDVVRDGGWLTRPGDERAYANAIDALLRDPAGRRLAGARARARIAADHLLPSARATIAAALLPLIGERRR